MEDIAGEALRVHADKDILGTVEFFHATCNQCHVLLAVDLVLVTQCGKRTEVRRQLGFDRATYLSLIVTAPFDELLDGYHLEVMLIRKTTQLFGTSHRGRVFLRDDFTQNTRWTQARQASQVDRGFRVPIT